MERETYQSSSGSKINLYSLFPMGEVRAVIHITHGMAEHAIRYARFASELTNAGFAVFTHDIEVMDSLKQMMHPKVYLANLMDLV